jgi:hypothetical protein
MSSKLTSLLAALALAGGLTTVHGVLAQDAQPAPSQPDRGMMHGQGMMDGGMMDRMTQMSRMMAGCNKMMESMNQTPSAPADPSAPTPRG